MQNATPVDAPRKDSVGRRLSRTVVVTGSFLLVGLVTSGPASAVDADSLANANVLGVQDAGSYVSDTASGVISDTVGSRRVVSDTVGTQFRDDFDDYTIVDRVVGRGQGNVLHRLTH